MINRDKTKLKYGYYPEELATTSANPVVWKCDSCPAEREYSYAYALKKYNKAMKTTGEELCQKCAHAHRKGKVVKPNSKVAPITLPPETDLGKTMEVYGINVEDLNPWSRQKVFMKCSCGKSTETKRCSLNSYKSILTTGHFKCIGCWTKERRKGLKLSEETKIKMAKSQQKRRNKNKVHQLPIRPVYPPLQCVANGDTNLSKNNRGAGASIIIFPKKK